MTDSAAFWDRIAPKYAVDPVADVKSYERTLARTASYLHPSDRVVELGGGTGTTALKLAPHVAGITVTDVSPGMVRISERRIAEAGAATVRARVAPAEAPLPPQSAEAVLGFNLLHLVADPGAVARVAHAALVPGGHFITKTFCFEGRWLALWPIARVMGALGRWPAVSFFPARWLEAEIARAGFEIVETDNHPWPRRFIVARKV